MNFFRFLALAFVAGLVAFSCVQSLSIGSEAVQAAQQQSSQQQQQQQQHGASVVASGNGPAVGTPANTTNDKNERAGTTGRYLAAVSSYEQPQVSYQAPVVTYQQESYVAPVVQQTYQQQTYQPQQQSYQQQTYVQPPVYEQPKQAYVQQPVYEQPKQSYVAPVTYEQPIVQTYQQPNYTAPVYQQQTYSQPSYQQTTYQTPSYSNYSTPSYQQQSYVQPQVTYQQTTYQTPSYQQTTYQTPSYSNYSTPSYQQQTYVQPQTYSNYSTPTYSAPVYTPPVYTPPVYTPPVYTPPPTPTYSNYSTPSYQQQTYVQPQVYEQPKQEYVAPVTTYQTTTYQAPTYQAPTYQTPTYQNYSTPSYQPQQQTYQQQTYVQPQVYEQPKQEYVAPVTTYQQPSYQQPSYQQQSYTPQVSYQQQSYQPQQTYQQQTYQPQQQTYQQQTYVQPTYQGTYPTQGSFSGVFKRQLGDPESPLNMTAGKSTLLDDMSASDSVVQATYVPAPVQVIKQQQPIVIKQQYPQQQYLDTQPEFTQSWADYSHPPGYLPQAYRSIPYFIPNYLAQHQQPYGKQQGAQQALALSPLSLGYGYVTWQGPIDPKSFYIQYHLPYYYKYPPMSPFYTPVPYKQQQYQIPALVKSVAVTTVRVVQPKPVIKVTGYGKRSLSAHDAAPYTQLVDHLAAAASDKNIVFANVSSIECPAKPSDYVCPQVLNAADKEALKKKICDYETVLTGTITLVPDVEKAQTRCGAIKLEKPIFKNAEDKTQLADKMAVVFGKGCQLKQLYESQTGQKLDSSEPRAHIMLKSPVPSSTKFILADGANMDLLNANLITKEEIVSMFQQCNKASS